MLLLALRQLMPSFASNSSYGACRLADAVPAEKEWLSTTMSIFADNNDPEKGDFGWGVVGELRLSCCRSLSGSRIHEDPLKLVEIIENHWKLVEKRPKTARILARSGDSSLRIHPRCPRGSG